MLTLSKIYAVKTGRPLFKSEMRSYEFYGFKNDFK